MSAGMEALREAARLEAAAFYSRAAGDGSRAARAAARAADELLYADAANNALISRAVRNGAGVRDLMEMFAMTRAEAVEVIRKAAA